MNKSNKTILKIVCVLGVLVIALIGLFIFLRIKYSTDTDSIGWADWLAAACSILSLTGTILLSCVAIKQNDKANETNDKLFLQNEKLQSINEHQFKIINQDLYPLLIVEMAIIEDATNSYTNKDAIWDKYWENSCIFFQRGFYLDNPENETLTTKRLYKRIAIGLKNSSKCKIAKLCLYRLELIDVNKEDPYVFYSPNAVQRITHEHIVLENDFFAFDLFLQYKNQSIFCKNKLL